MLSILGILHLSLVLKELYSIKYRLGISLICPTCELLVH